ncbi:fimbrial biogenesis chaperone [Yersinia intermedia]|uniref:fimbrial biogenesis chaperone n=1 Tax=Yersinia intermedia TaxID=631 RepID=UPI0005DAEEE3|nr:molecular chaperone [Yersinia intermedia]MDA5512865.1 molecular chaperone [Yersinia intermedia]CNI73477.1 putative fimbrial chaperone protein [Yersinia intermedia]
MSSRHASGCAAVLLLAAAPATAGISADATRIIFQASEVARGESIGLTSSATSLSPYLVKTQVTRDVQGQAVQVPFVTTPSLFRLEPGTTNQVRIMKTPGDLPHDRESLFYFRAVAMPAGLADSASPSPAVTGALQVATATVIKLFYRPVGLAIPQAQAMGQLQFAASKQGLKVTNPTPYYITLNSLRVNSTPVRLRVEDYSSMIAPYSSAWYRGAPQQGTVAWTTINDYGGTEVFHGTVQ